MRSLAQVGQTWPALDREVEERGLRARGKSREVYLETPHDDPGAWVTELQQPLG